MQGGLLGVTNTRFSSIPQQRMVSIIREAYANNTNIHGMIEHLSDVEKAVLQKVLTL